MWHANASQLDFRCPASAQQRLHRHTVLKALEVVQNDLTLHVQDVQLAHQRQTDADDDMHSRYHSLDSINSILDLLASDYPTLCEKVAVSKSAEGRPIYGLRVSNNVYSSSSLAQQKLGFVVIGGQHAREWIVCAVTNTALCQLSDSCRVRLQYSTS